MAESRNLVKSKVYFARVLARAYMTHIRVHLVILIGYVKLPMQQISYVHCTMFNTSHIAY